jgi:PAS domain S-box-containing protein
MRLQTRIISVTLSIFIIALLFLGVLVFSTSKVDFERQTKNQLVSISQTVKNTIKTFLSGQENKIELIANQNDLSNEELMKIVEIDGTFYDMFVIDSDGKVIRSSNPARIGIDRSNRAYFTEAKNKTFISPVYFALVPKEYSIAVSTPFKGGVLVGAMKLEVFNRIISDRSGLGETGENLMVFMNENNEMVYFTDRLFSDKKIEAVPKEKSENLLAYSALQGYEGPIQTTEDYRGAEVIAVANYIKEINCGLVTKIDRAEAFASVKKLQTNTTMIVLVIVILMIILIFVMTKPISKEIKNLADDINIITKGNLDVQLKKSSINEIRTLTDSLNRILTSMKLAILRTGITKDEIGLGEAVKAKEEAEEKYKQIFDSSNDAIFIHDMTGKFLEVNQTAAERLGYTKEEFMKLSPQKIDSPKFSKLVPARIKELQKNGKAVFDSAHVTKSGKEMPVEINSRVINFNGMPAIMSIARDISERRENEQKYRLLYESSNDAIMTLAPPSWRFTSGNPATIKMFKAKNEKDFISRAPWEFSPKKQPDGKLSSVKAKQMIEKAMKKGKNFFEWTHRRLNRENFPASVLLTKVKDNEKEYLQATVRDLSRRIR